MACCCAPPLLHCRTALPWSVCLPATTRLVGFLCCAPLCGCSVLWARVLLFVRPIPARLLAIPLRCPRRPGRWPQITFGTAIGEVALQPSPTTGTFTITVDGVSLFCRQTNPGKGFPELADIKRRLRDVIAPNTSLGHSDGKQGGETAADSLTA